MMAIHSLRHRYCHLTVIVMIFLALLATSATALSSFATWQVSRTSRSGAVSSCLTSPYTHTRTTGRAGNVRGGAYSRIGTTLQALAARRANASALRTVKKSRHIWWHPMRTKITAFGHVILGELQMLTWKQHLLMLTIFLAGISIGRSLSTFTVSRFCKINDIPPTYFGPSAPWLKGRAVSISDGDTFRFYHTPTCFHKSTLDKKKERLIDHTLLVRLCTIDTPETAKFGKPAQPFAEQAKQELQRLIENRIVWVRLLTKDQYGRAVGQVMVCSPGLGKLLRKKLSMDEVMLQAGLAEVYQGMGAVYGYKGKEHYLKLERTAQQSKKGMWALSKRESAADYKRRTKKDR